MYIVLFYSRQKPVNKSIIGTFEMLQKSFSCTRYQKCKAIVQNNCSEQDCAKCSLNKEISEHRDNVRLQIGNNWKLRFYMFVLIVHRC